MNKKTYIQPVIDVIALNGDTLMDGEWWSVGVDPNEEIEDDDICAKQGFFDEEDSSPGPKKNNIWDNY